MPIVGLRCIAPVSCSSRYRQSLLGHRVPIQWVKMNKEYNSVLEVA